MVEKKSITQCEELFTKDGANTILAELGAIRLLIQQFFEKPIKDDREILTVEQAAEILDLSVSAMKRYAMKTHELCYSIVGRKILIQRKDLFKFLENRKIASIYERGGTL